MVELHTGTSKGAGTSAKVSLQIFGRGNTRTNPIWLSEHNAIDIGLYKDPYGNELFDSDYSSHALQKSYNDFDSDMYKNRRSSKQTRSFIENNYSNTNTSAKSELFSRGKIRKFLLKDVQDVGVIERIRLRTIFKLILLSKDI